MNAKEFVNSIYQPSGYLSCGVSNDKMWKYAKNAAIISVKYQIDNLVNLDGNQSKQLYSLIDEINKL